MAFNNLSIPITIMDFDIIIFSVCLLPLKYGGQYLAISANYIIIRKICLSL